MAVGRSSPKSWGPSPGSTGRGGGRAAAATAAPGPEDSAPAPPPARGGALPNGWAPTGRGARLGGAARRALSRASSAVEKAPRGRDRAPRPAPASFAPGAFLAGERDRPVSPRVHWSHRGAATVLEGGGYSGVEQRPGWVEKSEWAPRSICSVLSSVSIIKTTLSQCLPIGYPFRQ